MEGASSLWRMDHSRSAWSKVSSSTKVLPLEEIVSGTLTKTGSLRPCLEMKYMSFKIVVDSCCDLTPSMLKDPVFVKVPLTISSNGSTFVDRGAAEGPSRWPFNRFLLYRLKIGSGTAADGADIVVGAWRPPLP